MIPADLTDDAYEPLPRYTKLAHIYDALYCGAGKDYQREAEQVHALIQQHQRSTDNSLLDVACGTGGHLAYLRRWYAAEGLDLSTNMLDVARKRFPEIKLHWGNMVDFDLGKQFGAVICLFSSIGYAKTVENLRAAVQTMDRHLLSGGVLIIEPWFTPDAYREGTAHATFVDEPELKIARMCISERKGSLSVMEMHYLLAMDQQIDHFTDLHEMGLFTHGEYASAITGAGLSLTHMSDGLTGRGLYIGVKAEE
jgi:SAM-dependent methyltransferase